MVKKHAQLTVVLACLLLQIPTFDLTAKDIGPNPVARRTILQPSAALFQFKQQVLNSVRVATRTALRFQTVEPRENGLQQQAPQKSRGRAFLQSLILPGWGQYYAESKTMFKVFALTEVMLLASYTGFKVWSNWKEDDFRTFAVTHADVKLEGKPGRYFVDIGNFDNIFDFNQFQLQNRNVAALYPETEEFAWQWDSKANRDRFEDMRISRDRADDRARFTLAAIFVNHVVSAIHSTLAVYKLNKRLARKGLGLHFDIDSYSRNRHVALALVKKF